MSDKKESKQYLGDMTQVIAKLLANASAEHNEAVAGDTAVEYHDRDNRVIALPGKPDKMGLGEASARLAAMAAFEDQEFTIDEQIPGLPLDAAHAFVMVLRERYGWAETKSATKQGFFGPFKTKPDMHRVSTGPGPEDFVEVPVGNFELTDITSIVETGFERSRTTRGMAAFYVKATVKHKDRRLIQHLIGETKKYLAKHSIYRGKAMRLRVETDGTVGPMFEPEFVDVSGVDERTLVHPRTTELLLQTGLWTPIRQIDVCRKHHIPLKRTVLLSGPYGTGKTLTASVTAKIGVKHNWTFVTVDSARGLKHALEFAKRYQPAVVFAEDIDRVMSDRSDEGANDLLNIIDGILGKDCEVITVLTSNHIDRIEPAMLRPGRIDLMVPVGLPDADAAQRMVRVYAGDMLDEHADLSEVGQAMQGFIPAAIREVIERAKLGMILEERGFLTAADLFAAAVGMKAHADLSAPKEVVPSDEEKLGTAFKVVVAKQFNGQAEKLDKIVEAVS